MPNHADGTLDHGTPPLSAGMPLAKASTAIKNTLINGLDSRPLNRDAAIETLRAFAIILVIAYHVAGDVRLGDAKSIYEYLAYSFQPVRMPLFTMISGYLYAIRPVQSGTVAAFMRGKMRRLLLPLLCVATLEYVATSLLPFIHKPTDISLIWRIYVFPYEHYWFLQSLILVFFFIVGLELLGFLRSVSGWLICLTLAILFSLHRPDIDMLSFEGSIYLLPSFLLGYGFNRFSSALFEHKWVAVASLLVLVIGVPLHQQAWFHTVSYATKPGTPLVLAISFAVGYLLFRYRKAIPVLAYVGSFAFSIYLFQGFGTALGRRLADAINIYGIAYFICVILIALAFGIAMDRILRITKIGRRLFLGLR